MKNVLMAAALVAVFGVAHAQEGTAPKADAPAANAHGMEMKKEHQSDKAAAAQEKKEEKKEEKAAGKKHHGKKK
jgi:hypothetical protein